MVGVNLLRVDDAEAFQVLDDEGRLFTDGDCEMNDEDVDDEGDDEGDDLDDGKLVVVDDVDEVDEVDVDEGDTEVEDKVLTELEGSTVVVLLEDETIKDVDSDVAEVERVMKMDEETGGEVILQVAQQVKFPPCLEQSSVVHPAVLSPYSHPATSTSK